MTTNSPAPIIVLVNPQLSENIGMVARAMMNCGLKHLRIVAPRESHLSEHAIRASSGAEQILQNAELFTTTREAVADLEYVFATTARRRDMIKPVKTAHSAAQEILSSNTKYGILFGPERTGLHNDDVSLANCIIEIPLNPEHCSLNLSQAVLLVAYEWYQQKICSEPDRFVTNKTVVADKEKVMLFLDFLEQKLENRGIFKQEDKKERMLINLNNIFTRTRITEQELNTLYGIINLLNLPNHPQ